MSTLAIDLADLRDAVTELRQARTDDHESIEDVEEHVERIAADVNGLRDLITTNHTAVMAALDERKQAADRRAETIARIVERVTSRDFLIFLGIVLVVFAVVFGGAAFDSEWFKINTPSATPADAVEEVASLPPRAPSPAIGLHLHP